MFSIVLLFGLINTISGNNRTISPSSNSTSVAWTTSAVYRNNSLAKYTNETSKGNSSVTELAEFRVSATSSFQTSFATQYSFVSSSGRPIGLSTGKTRTSRTRVREIVTRNTIISSTTSKRISPISTPFSLATFPEKSNQTNTIISTSGTLQTSQTSTPTRTATTTTTTTTTTTKTTPPPPKPTRTATTTRTGTGKSEDKEKIFFWLVTTGTLIYMFYGTAGVLLLCIILLIVACCCLRRQRRTTKALKRKDTTLSNPYINSDRNNHHVVGFPSPLQLDTFVLKPESPYDMPEIVEHLPRDPEVSYVTVIDGNESDSDYAAVKVNGTANSIADSESRDDDLQMSAEYTNASVFQIDPYAELMPAANRSDEDHYTSLIKRDKSEDDEASV